MEAFQSSSSYHEDFGRSWGRFFTARRTSQPIRAASRRSHPWGLPRKPSQQYKTVSSSPVTAVEMFESRFQLCVQEEEGLGRCVEGLFICRARSTPDKRQAPGGLFNRPYEIDGWMVRSELKKRSENALEAIYAHFASCYFLGCPLNFKSVVAQTSARVE